MEYNTPIEFSEKLKTKIKKELVEQANKEIETILENFK